MSSCYAITVLAVWVWHLCVFHQPMPDIPWLITSIANAPFAAGVIATLRIPKKARARIESK